MICVFYSKDKAKVLGGTQKANTRAPRRVCIDIAHSGITNRKKVFFQDKTGQAGSITDKQHDRH